MAIKLIYRDIALGAEGAAVSSSAAESFSDITKVPYGVTPPPTATCEPNGWGLIPEYKVRSGQPFAFWSVDRSGTDCSFSNPPTITLDFSQQFTSTGLTITFSPDAMDYCTQIRILWYQDGVVKHDEVFYPTAPQFVAQRTVEAFDKLVFEFVKTSLPGKRVKVEDIVIGVIRHFEGDELKSASFVHEIDLISDTVPINVLDASFHSLNDVDFVFQRKQPVTGYNDDKLIGVYYISEGRRTGATDYEIKCNDALGILDLEDYDGGLWLTDTPLVDILQEVFGGTFVFEIDAAFEGSTLRGYIEPGKKREALKHIAFALGAVVDTSGSSAIKLYPAPVGTGSTIPAAQTYTGGAVTVSDKVTEVTVTAYVIFDERPGENDEYIEHNGVQYRYYTDTKHAYNPDTVASDPANKIRFDKSYLVNLSNAQMLADKIMQHYMRREKYAFKHVLSGQMPSDRALVTLPWDGEAGGNITKMTISVTGIAVSETEMLLD